ncbi:ribosome recycling factor [bacterium]|nr:ribosome recycling factor [bacterium]
MAYDFSPFKKKLGDAEDWFGEELLSIRTGRAAPSILDGIFVDSYGTKTLLKHVAGISIEDARTLRVSPWDKSQIKQIEKAIEEANLGVSVSSDEAGVRVFFPELTEDRRKMLMKLAKERLEDARVSVRKERDEVWKDVQEKEKDGDISEDDKFKLKDEMQKLVDGTNGKLDEFLEKKEREIMG